VILRAVRGTNAALDARSAPLALAASLELSLLFFLRLSSVISASSLVLLAAEEDAAEEEAEACFVSVAAEAAPDAEAAAATVAAEAVDVALPSQSIADASRFF
jgi:hypothetical protein